MVLYKCNTCNKLFKQKNDYRRHKNRKIPCKKQNHKINHKNHKNDSQFECNLCTKMYSTISNLNRHMKYYCKGNIDRKNDLNIQDAIDVIDYDDQNDSTNNDLECQENLPPHKTHKPHKNAQHKSQYTCEYCEKMFTRRDTLTRHKKKYGKVRKENEKEMENI